MPVKEIAISAPELSRAIPDDYEVVSIKTTYWLGQLPGTQTVLKHTRPVVKRKSTRTLTKTPAPANVLERSIADVSFFSGYIAG